MNSAGGPPRFARFEVKSLLIDNWKEQQQICSVHLLHVQISMLSDWIFNDDVLQNTPSRKDGISLEQEKLYRFRTAWFIEELGREMLISRTIVSMAIAYFQRFYLFQSFKQHNRFVRHLFHS